MISEWPGVLEALKSHLAPLVKQSPAQIALLEEGEGSVCWRVAWSSSEIAVPVDLSLPEVPAQISWDSAPGPIVGASIQSAWARLGVLAWADDPVTLTHLVATTLRLGQSESERRWVKTTTALLGALKEQRRELGTAIHRGPAQSITAARLELSMLSPQSYPETLKQALESAAESLIDIVHGKLRGRGPINQDETLEQALRTELGFQARWRDLPCTDSQLSLPASELNSTLAKLWKLSGGQVQEGPGEATFTGVAS